MTYRIGIALEADRVRAVALGRFGHAPRARVEVPWDPVRPAEAVAALRARLGGGRRVALSIGIGFLNVARVSLPPVSAVERRRALALEPSRHFAIEGDAVVALLGPEPSSGGEPAFAANAAQVDAWLEVFSALGPVECVEAAPTSLARTLRLTPLTGRVALPAGADEIGVVEVRGGQVVQVRRAPRVTIDEAPAPLDDPWRVALGAALGTNSAPELQLLSDTGARTIGARRTRRLVTAAATCGLALGLALISADRARERRLSHINAELAVASRQAAPAESLAARIASLAAADRVAADLAARRSSALVVLRALGDRLPADAVVQALRVDGNAWTVDGVARNAAAVVPALDADPRFGDVRSAAPSSRLARDGGARETFSVAFTARPAAR